MEPMQPMKPMEPMEPMEKWWPADLGEPSSTGAQNDMRYAFFPESHRLVVEINGQRNTYNTGDHRIGGVQQQGGRSPEFSSQKGPVKLEDLKVVG